jgi:hypothetical protein
VHRIARLESVAKVESTEAAAQVAFPTNSQVSKPGSNSAAAGRNKRASILNSGMIGSVHARWNRLADSGRIPLCPTAIPCTSYVRVLVFLVQYGILDH